MSEIHVVDSSGWLEYLANSPAANNFAPAIDDTDHLIVPVITVYEVFKKFRRELGVREAFAAVGVMKSGRVIDVDESIVLDAATYKLPLADSLIYATAQLCRATLWTQDEHFKDLPDVRYFAKAGLSGD